MEQIADFGKAIQIAIYIYKALSYGDIDRILESYV